MNQIILLGRLTRDPEMRYTQEGTAVTRFNIAVRRDRSDKADFINCITFGKTAESTAQYCNKGRQILISGRLEINTKTNQNNNQTEYYTQVVANKIEFLAQPKGNQQQNQGNHQQARPAQGNNAQQPERHHQQRFQPGPNGWQNPTDQDMPF